MKRYFIFMGMLVFFLNTACVFAEVNDCDVEVGCSDDDPVLAQKDVEVLSYDEFFKIYTENKLDYVLLDVRPKTSYDQGHIKGAESLFIPQTTPEQVGKILPDKDQVVVVYCASHKCNMSHYAALALLNAGYKKVFDYKGGIYEWLSKGNPIESVPAKEPLPASEASTVDP